MIREVHMTDPVRPYPAYRALTEECLSYADANVCEHNIDSLDSNIRDTESTSNTNLQCTLANFITPQQGWRGGRIVKKRSRVGYSHRVVGSRLQTIGYINSMIATCLHSDHPIERIRESFFCRNDDLTYCLEEAQKFAAKYYTPQSYCSIAQVLGTWTSGFFVWCDRPIIQETEGTAVSQGDN